MRTEPSRCLRLGALMLILAFLGQTFRWELAQAGAWMTMIRDFRQSESLSTALDKTFSGEAPCPACTRLAREKTSPSTDDAALEASTPEAQPLAPPRDPGLTPWPKYGLRLQHVTGGLPGSPQRPSPPVPPPRHV